MTNWNGILLGYIDHELNFNSESTCTNTCEDYTNAKHIRCEPKTLCAQNRNTDVAICSGDIRDCKELDSDDVEICFGDEDQRYYYLKYNDGTQYGQLPPNTNCSSNNYVIVVHFSFTQRQNEFYKMQNVFYQ